MIFRFWSVACRNLLVAWGFLKKLHLGAKIWWSKIEKIWLVACGFWSVAWGKLKKLHLGAQFWITKFARSVQKLVRSVGILMKIDENLAHQILEKVWLLHLKMHVFRGPVVSR